MALDRRDRPPLPLWIGRPLEPLYRAVVARRNRAFDAGHRVTHLPIPVISVGNLSVGGTGKTPMVMRLLCTLNTAGLRPAVAMRGYRARAGQLSDEQAEYLARYPQTHIVAQANRTAGVQDLLARCPGSVDCLILDDGFQHRFIARDLDIVLIDASRSPLHEHCLPAGWLREPLTSLTRAHAIVLTHTTSAPATDIDAIEAAVTRYRNDLLVARAQHRWAELHEGAATHPLAWLTGKRIIAVCGIGNSRPFFAAAQHSGATLLHSASMPDHHHWSVSDLQSLAERYPHADALLTTSKDWVKIAPLLQATALPWPVVRPSLELDFLSNEQALMTRVRAAVGAPR